jgi:cyclic pyranopterin phosphate synthase
MTQTEMLAQIQTRFGALTSLPVDHGSTSRIWRIPALDNYVFGIVPTMGETLCAECDRLRLTADGRVLNCLFDAKGVSIREALRAENDEAVRHAIELHMAHKGIGFLAANRQTPNLVPLDHMHRVGG